MILRAFLRGGVAALAVILAAVPLAVPAQSVDPAALLAKHQAYVGWHAGDGNIKTLRESGTATRDGKTVAELRKLYYGYAHRDTTIDRRGLHFDDGFTGNVFWTTSENGFTIRPAGEVARYLIDVDILFGELTADLTPAFLRRETLDGSEAVVLRLTGKVGFPIDVWVDPTTGAFRAATIDPGGKYEDRLRGLAYTEVGGKRYLSSWRWGNGKSLFTLSSIEPNAAIAPDDLRPPKQTATWTFGAAPATVELTKDNFPRIFIDAVVNGVKGRFILDTGADGVVLVDSFARRVGAKRAGAVQIGGIGPKAASANLYRVDTIGFGASTLQNVIVVSGLDEEWMKREGVSGLIGFDLFGGAIVNLDLDAGQLHIMDPAKVQPDESKGIVVHVDLSNGHIRVPMKLADRVDVIATLDSGNPINVLFARELAVNERIPFLVDPTEIGSKRYGSGLGGEEIEHCGKLPSLALGPIQYKPVPACDSPSFSRNEVLVGLDFMKNFNYVFDYPNGVVVMIPRKGGVT